DVRWRREHHFGTGRCRLAERTPSWHDMSCWPGQSGDVGWHPPARQDTPRTFGSIKKGVCPGLRRRLAHAVLCAPSEDSRLRLLEPDGCRATGPTGRVPQPPRLAQIKRVSLATPG